VTAAPLRKVKLEEARRLAVARQQLAGPRRPINSPEDILGVVRDLNCLQLDPISVLARSPLLVLWSRLGPFDRSHLDQLLWEDRSLFEYWAHAASIVLTEHYQIHHLLMRRYPTQRYSHGRRTAEWLRDNQALRAHVLQRLRRDGPVRMSDIEDLSERPWKSDGWTTGRNVERMIDTLWTQGKVMVARREGLTKWWDLAERCLPDWTPRRRLTEPQIVTRAAERSLRALGIARQRDIERHFTIGRYHGLPAVLSKFMAAGVVEKVRIIDDGTEVPGTWYVHADDLPHLEAIQARRWEPRTTLLSPFDNLIIDRARTELLFGFNYRMEIYVAKANRRFGYYVLPILAGDRFVGRLDAAADRVGERLIVHAIHAEPAIKPTQEVGRGVARALGELATFVGARRIEYPPDVPRGWKGALS
jgi:uncharacterized protein YcaQ